MRAKRSRRTSCVILSGARLRAQSKDRLCHPERSVRRANARQAQSKDEDRVDARTAAQRRYELGDNRKAGSDDGRESQAEAIPAWCASIESAAISSSRYAVWSGLGPQAIKPRTSPRSVIGKNSTCSSSSFCAAVSNGCSQRRSRKSIGSL